MPGTIRVMTFNLRRDIPADGDNRWALRREAAAAVVRAAAPHVLGTQELLPHQVADFDASLPEYARVGRCRRGGAQDEFNAIFYDPRRLRLHAHGDFWLSATPEEPGSRSWGNEFPRMATWAAFEDALTGACFDVYNTHLDHRSGTSRAKSADLLTSRMGDRAILLGDFNTVPGAPVHRRFTRRLADSTAAAERLAPGGLATFHGFSRRPLARIDWILAPREASVRTHRVLRDRPGGAYPSDHDPVVADLEFPS